MRASYSSRVREVAKEFSQTGAAFRVTDLEKVVGVQTYEERRKLRKATEELVRRKEFQRVDRGLYRYIGKEAKPQKQQVMWRFLRMNRSVTLEELRVVLGVPENYAQEWLSHLVKHGIVRVKGEGRFQLVKDSLDMPANTEKADRLRRLRESKIRALKDALQHLRAKHSELSMILQFIKEGLHVTAIDEADRIETEQAIERLNQDHPLETDAKHIGGEYHADRQQGKGDSPHCKTATWDQR